MFPLVSVKHMRGFVATEMNKKKKKHLSFHVDTLASLESNGGALICYFPLLALAAFHLVCLSAAQLYVT